MVIVMVFEIIVMYLYYSSYKCFGRETVQIYVVEVGPFTFQPLENNVCIV